MLRHVESSTAGRVQGARTATDASRFSTHGMVPSSKRDMIQRWWSRTQLILWDVQTRTDRKVTEIVVVG